MANTTLKALKNTVDVIGRVKEVNLELGITRDGNINGLYTGYETVMNEYKSISDVGDKKEADLVHVQGSLELNEYISQDGTKRSSNQVSGKFFNRIKIGRAHV